MMHAHPPHRTGRALITLIVIVLAAGAGVVGGLWYAKGQAGASQAAAPANGGDAHVMYTCGMHPNVVQEGPGDCPICGMKLTPVKSDEEEEGGGAAAGGPEQRKILYWRAPMNPGFVSDKPGKSPMGMDLVPVYADAGQTSTGKAIRIDPVTIQNMGIRTARIKRGPLVRVIRTLGEVEYDERKVGFITTKFRGWIEKLNVDETGQLVHVGQPLFDIYSPEVYEAQSAYLAALRYLPVMSDSNRQWAKQEAERNVEVAITKLRLLDIPRDQIEELKDSQEIRDTLTIRSPFDGIVTEKMALKGMFVNPGMKIYTIADLSTVWAYVSIYEYQLPWVRVGQEATMELPYFRGEKFKGKVVYIYPYLSEKTRDTKVRLEFDNADGKLFPNMLANVRLEAKLSDDAVLIPREAYLDSGERKVTFVDRGSGKFEPREIRVGVEAEGGMVEVLQGLDAGEVVVTSGQFLLDAESKLKEAMAKMLEARRVAAAKKGAPAAEPKASHDAHAGHEMKAMPPTTMPADAKFACPMEKHPSEEDPAHQGAFFSPTPGKCPWCGMKLKPIDKIAWAGKYRSGAGAKPEGPRPGPSTQPAARTPGRVVPSDARYACPMETHPDEADPAKQGPYFSSKSGACPRCGMKLKPIEELEWVQALRAAAGADVAYTCPDHQHVFSSKPGKCPRCGRKLEPFKVMYTCRLPEHAGVISTVPGACPHCQQALAAYRGPWLSEAMAQGNVPPTTQPAATAAYRCAKHPLVYSNQPGSCTICGRPLESTGVPATLPTLAATRPATTAPSGYVCPMHPQVRMATPGLCSICNMRLVPAHKAAMPTTVPAQIRRALTHVTEHYLAMRHLLASDTETGLAANALGLGQATEAIIEHFEHAGADLDEKTRQAIAKIHGAALEMTGRDLAADRVRFAEISAGFIGLLDSMRPDHTRWPKFTVYRCPMAKADWVQADDVMGNPYYGIKMLKCGDVQSTK